MEAVSWSVIFSAVKAGDTVIDDNKRKKLLKKLKLLLRSKRKIVLFGISGAGKTQFINSLNKVLAIPDRTLLTEAISYELEDFPIVFKDTPGHGTRDVSRKDEIDKIIKHKVAGIINVCSYGYEETPDASIKAVVQENGEIEPDYMRANRNAELARLQEWMPRIGPDNVRWIINLVNKADLWWDDFDTVQGYYTKGDYSKHFESFGSYRHVLTLPYCSIIKPYFGISTSGKFGEIQKEQMQKYLLHQLLTLLSNK